MMVIIVTILNKEDMKESQHENGGYTEVSSVNSLYSYVKNQGSMSQTNTRQLAIPKLLFIKSKTVGQYQ